MMRIVELDGLAKDRESVVFVVTIGDDKIGVSAQDMIDLIRAKHGRSQPKRRPASPELVTEVKQAVE